MQKKIKRESSETYNTIINNYIAKNNNNKTDNKIHKIGNRKNLYKGLSN